MLKFKAMFGGEKHTPIKECDEFIKEIEEVTFPIMDKYIEKGYNPLELQYLLTCLCFGMKCAKGIAKARYEYERGLSK